MRTIATILLASLLAAPLGACSLDVPDLNNPGIDDLENNPTPSAVAAACTGLLIGNRRNVAQSNGLVLQLGVLGREAYDFDAADPRYVGELIAGTLNPGSPFGGNFWAQPYANLRNGNIVLGAVDKVPDFSAADQAAIRGFTETIQALDLLEVMDTHDTNGAVIDTDLPIDQLGAIVPKPMVLAKIASLLDDAKTQLAAGGDAFPFALSAGYQGFDTPATFLTFNRAIRARVAIYAGDFDGALAALGESFLDDGAAADLDAGVYHTYGTSSGDTTNGLINPNIYAHPSLTTDVQKQADGDPDDRLTRKVTKADKPGSAQGLSSDDAFTIYTSPSSPVPIIRNEELILLRAEAEIGKNDVAAAADDLNLIRTRSGGLAARADLTAGNIVDELLYNRRYSLMFEGHRWIDLRRFGKDLPLDMPTDIRNVRYPIPLNECNARTNEPACALGST